jgi:hypothetical protein
MTKRLWTSSYDKVTVSLFLIFSSFLFPSFGMRDRDKTSFFTCLCFSVKDGRMEGWQEGEISGFTFRLLFMSLLCVVTAERRDFLPASFSFVPRKMRTVQRHTLDPKDTDSFSRSFVGVSSLVPFSG